MPDDRRILIEERVRRLPQAVQTELGALKQHEPRIREALKDADTARLFFTDPARALEGLGVALTPELKARMANARITPATTLERTVTRPDGRTLTVHVTVKRSPRGEP